MSLVPQVPVYSVCKNPEKYDDYVCSLSDKFLKKAETELREEPHIREQCLSQFRDWIAKHPHIKKCRTDTVFLLGFLRVRKFNFLDACETLERYLAVRQMNPEWFKNLDIEDSDISDMLDSGIFIPLRDVTDDGCLVFLRVASKFNQNIHSASKLLRLFHLMLDVYLEDEKIQVSGMKIISDETNASMKYLTMLSFTEYKKIIECYQSAYPLRIAGIHICNFPPFTTKLINYVISLTNKKLKSRVFCHQTMDGLYSDTDKSSLPKEYGGIVPIAELLDDFKTKARQYRDRIKMMEDMEIEITKTSKYWEDTSDSGIDKGVVGSFRKLQVD